jgi:hypothetical protein
VSATAPPVERTIEAPTSHGRERPCHTIIAGRSLCGIRVSGKGLHSMADCLAGKHSRCARCDALDEPTSSRRG